MMMDSFLPLGRSGWKVEHIAAAFRLEQTATRRCFPVVGTPSPAGPRAPTAGGALLNSRRNAMASTPALSRPLAAGAGSLRQPAPVFIRVTAYRQHSDR